MTDALAEVTTYLKHLKKRDTLDGITVVDNRIGCDVRLTRGLLYASGTGKNFGIAYTSALKRLDGRMKQGVKDD